MTEETLTIVPITGEYLLILLGLIIFYPILILAVTMTQYAVLWVLETTFKTLTGKRGKANEVHF